MLSKEKIAEARARALEYFERAHIVLTDEEKAGVPDSFVTAPAKGLGKDAPKYNFRMQLSPYDCLGCGVCAYACRTGALVRSASEERR